MARKFTSPVRKENDMQPDLICSCGSPTGTEAVAGPIKRHGSGMMSMPAFLGIIFVFGSISGLFGANDEQIARRFAEQRWLIPGMAGTGQNLRIGRIEEASELDTLIAFNGQAFRIVIENSGSGFSGRNSITYTVVVNKGKARGFEYEEEALDFLVKNAEPVKTDEEAAGLVEAFGHLMNWKLLSKSRANGVTLKKDGADWLADCAFVTDPFLKGLVKLRFRISPDGKIRIAEKSGNPK